VIADAIIKPMIAELGGPDRRSRQGVLPVLMKELTEGGIGDTSGGFFAESIGLDHRRSGGWRSGWFGHWRLRSAAKEKPEHVHSPAE
jgi:hypothetical protein